jgi:DNA-binding CsgD family transcriptional regulator
MLWMPGPCRGHIRCKVSTEVAVDENMRRRSIEPVPHLQRPAAISRLSGQQEAKEQALTTALDHVEAAVFLVNAGGAITFTNDPARKLLAEAVVVRERDGALRAVASDTDRMLREILTSAANDDASLGVRGVAMPLMASSEQRWFVHVLPLTSGRPQEHGQANDAVAAVFVRNTAPNAPPPMGAIAKLYKLTAGEVRVLDALLKINGVRAMSDRLGISEGTVRTHLHNLFRKTNTRRQADLVKLVAGI